MTDSAEKLLREASGLLYMAYNAFDRNDAIDWKSLKFAADRITAHLSAHPVTEGDANGGWISVADRLPRDEEEYLVSMRRNDGSNYITTSNMTPSLNGFYVLYDGDGANPIEIVTHWQPLPAAPMTAASGMDEGE